MAGLYHMVSGRNDLGHKPHPCQLVGNKRPWGKASTHLLRSHMSDMKFLIHGPYGIEAPNFSSIQRRDRTRSQRERWGDERADKNKPTKAVKPKEFIQSSRANTDANQEAPRGIVKSPTKDTINPGYFYRILRHIFCWRSIEDP